MKSIIVLLLIVSALYSGESEERDRITEVSMQLFEKGDYVTLNGLAEMYRENKERTSGGRWKLRYLYKGLFNIYDLHTTEEQYWDTLEKKTLGWAKQHTNSPAAHLMHASFFLNKAWMYRGQNYARYVKKENWSLFYNGVSKAKQYLIAHKKIASTDPQWYALMLSIARAENLDKKSFLLLLDEALQRYPDYYAIYEFALYYMSPKWNDFSKEEIEQVAQKILKASKEDDHGVYARFYWMAHDIIYKDRLFFASDIDRNRMNHSMDRLLERYPTQYNINHFAYFSCLSKDQDQTEKLMQMIKDEPLLEVWKNEDDFNSCRSFYKNNERKTQTRIITPKHVEEYIQNNTSDKPLLVYFASFDKNCQLCGKSVIDRMADEYKNKMSFVAVNFLPGTSPYRYMNLYMNYNLQRLPSMMILYKKKIIVRLDEHYLEYEGYFKQRISEILEELEQPDFLDRFKETITDDASYLNTLDNVRINEFNYKKISSYKATAYAVSRIKSDYEVSTVYRAKTQEEANLRALEECEQKRIKTGMVDKCKLYLIGDKYVYEDN